jgi:hypothetical protein
MIRDPSDGSKREAKGLNPDANEINSIAAKRRSKEITSGLPPITKEQAAEAERLKLSREWLQQYRKAVDDLNRMNDKGEITTEQAQP